MDLSNGRYLALGLQNEEPKSYDFTIKRTAVGLPAERAGAARSALGTASCGARALLLLAVLGSAPAAPGGARSAPRAAEPARLADRSLLTAIAAAGDAAGGGR